MGLPVYLGCLPIVAQPLAAASRNSAASVQLTLRGPERGLIVSYAWWLFAVVLCPTRLHNTASCPGKPSSCTWVVSPNCARNLKRNYFPVFHVEQQQQLLPGCSSDSCLDSTCCSERMENDRTK